MQRTMCKGKIHRATVTQANLNYIGSITIDQDLLDAANIYPYEKVQVVNVNNGSRLETYTIAGVSRFRRHLPQRGSRPPECRGGSRDYHELRPVRRAGNPLT